MSLVPKSRAGTREGHIIQLLQNSCCIEKYEMISGRLNMKVIRLKGYKRIKRNTLVMCEDYEVYFLRRSIVVVTNPREGGDVRGSPLAVIMGLVDSRKAHTTPDLQVLCPVICLVAGVHISHEKNMGWSVGVSREHQWLFSLPETMRDMIVSKHGS